MQVLNSDGSWTAPDGQAWYTRPQFDPVKKREWLQKHPGQEWMGPGEEYEVNWPRLRELMVLNDRARLCS